MTQAQAQACYTYEDVRRMVERYITGFDRPDLHNRPAPRLTPFICPVCLGRKQVAGKRCRNCQGSGTVIDKPDRQGGGTVSVNNDVFERIAFFEAWMKLRSELKAVLWCLYALRLDAEEARWELKRRGHPKAGNPMSERTVFRRRREAIERLTDLLNAAYEQTFDTIGSGVV